MNNPLNIPHSPIRWRGMTREQNDPHFVSFVSPAYGYCAAFLLLFQQRQSYGCMTIRQVIEHSDFFPSSQRDTCIKFVSVLCHISPDKLIAGQDLNAFIDIMSAISRLINNKRPLRSQVCMGLWYAMRFKDRVKILM